MAKKSKQPKEIKTVEQGLPLPPNMPTIPPEMEKKLKAIKDKLDKFKEKVLDKFGDYIVGITLLPPEKLKEGEQPRESEERPGRAMPEVPGTAQEKKEGDENKIHLLVVVDDTTSQKMTKDELFNKFSSAIKQLAEEVDKEITPQCALLTDLWQNCYDAKYDLNRLISMSAPLHDTGMLAAIKIAEIHKSMVIKKFEKYKIGRAHV